MDREWVSGIFKYRVPGAIWLGRNNLVGDRQADTVHHGGPDRPVLAYSADHYPLWRDELTVHHLDHGAFGENFTIQGLDEDSVCIGDTYALGNARLQVSQPRQPCWKLERRLRQPGLVERVVATGRTGWYLRVLQEAEISAGAEVVLLERSCPQWTITRAHEVMRRRVEQPDDALALADSGYLSADWQRALRG